MLTLSHLEPIRIAASLVDASEVVAEDLAAQFVDRQLAVSLTSFMRVSHTAYTRRQIDSLHQNLHLHTFSLLPHRLLVISHIQSPQAHIYPNAPPTTIANANLAALLVDAEEVWPPPSPRRIVENLNLRSEMSTGVVVPVVAAVTRLVVVVERKTTGVIAAVGAIRLVDAVKDIIV